MFGRKKKDVDDGVEKPAKAPDKMVIAVRQRRAISAWDGIVLRPGFLGLKVKLRKYVDNDMLDEIRAGLDRESGKRRDFDTASLAAALRTASSRADAVYGTTLAVDVALNDVPLGRWARVAPGPVLRGIAESLPTMRAGFALMGDEDATVLVDPNDSGGFTLTVIGEWPEEFAAALLG